jgi:hypothetical protein
MFEKYYIYIYRLIRLLIISVISYLILKFTPSLELSLSDTLKMLFLIIVAFMFVDNYWPNIYYE